MEWVCRMDFYVRWQLLRWIAVSLGKARLAAVFVHKQRNFVCFEILLFDPSGAYLESSWYCELFGVGEDEES